MPLRSTKDRNDRFFKQAFCAILAIGLFLRSYQYLLNRSLWHDEAHLALNFVDLGFRGLTQPLENFQMAPIGFLFSVEAVSRIAGLGEMALRFVPFLFSIAALPLFYYFTRDLTRSRLTAIIAFLVYAFNLSFVYYASELKPYTIDVSVYVVLGYLIFAQHAFVARHRTLLLCVTGCLSVLFSNATIVVFVCTGIYFIAQWIMYLRICKKESRKPQLPLQYLYILCSWAVVFLTNYFTFLFHDKYAAAMRWVWSDAFCPTPLFGPEFNKFMSGYLPGVIMSEIFLFDHYFWYIAALLIVGGLVYSISKKKYIVILFTVLPFLIHLVLSMLRLYPFYYRFLLYTAPGIIILMAIGMVAIINLRQSKGYRIGASAMVIICMALGIKNSILDFPRYDIRIKPTLAYINAHYPNTTVLLTTPYSMYEYYYKTGLVKNGHYKTIGWNLSTDSFLRDTAVIKQHTNYIVLHSVIGGDNASVFIPGLRKRGLVVKEFRNNDFGVTELKPASDVTRDNLKN